VPNELNVSIIILNWNGKKDTLECLNSVTKINYKKLSIIIADNGSTDDSVLEIRNRYPNLTMVENGANLGFAEGNNHAISYALNHGADAVVILNNDTIVHKNLIQSFIDAYQSLDRVGILGATCFYYDNPEVIWTCGANFDNDSLHFNYLHQGLKASDTPEEKLTPVDYIVGCVMFVPKEVINSAGLMDKTYFLNFEEFDWCNKIRESGYTNYTVKDAMIWHKISSSFGGKNSPLKNYFLTRNFFLWIKRYHPELLPKLFIKSMLELNPPLTIDINDKHIFKSIFWSVIKWPSICKKHFTSPQFISQAYGIYHYLTKRFDDCPEKLKQRLTKP